MRIGQQFANNGTCCLTSTARNFPPPLCEPHTSALSESPPPLARLPQPPRHRRWLWRDSPSPTVSAPCLCPHTAAFGSLLPTSPFASDGSALPC